MEVEESTLPARKELYLASGLTITCTLYGQLSSLRQRVDLVTLAPYKIVISHGENGQPILVLVSVIKIS